MTGRLAFLDADAQHFLRGTTGRFINYPDKVGRRCPSVKVRMEEYGYCRHAQRIRQVHGPAVASYK